MPRKLFKIGESMPAPSERPGSGSPDDSGVRRKPRREEPNVIVDPELQKEARKAALLEDLAELKQRMKEMKGVWGGESYFILNDRVQNIEKHLAKLDGRDEGKKPAVEKSLPATEEAHIAREMTPADRAADARKTVKELNKERREIDAAQRRVMAVLRKGGMGNVADIEAELEGMGEELRGEVSGAKPSFGYRMHKVLRGLMGYERPPEVEEALKGYLELEQRGNANLRASHDAEALLTEAEAATGKKRSPRLRVGRSPEAPATHLDMSGFARTFIEGPEAAMGGEHVGQELEALKHLEKGSLSREPRIRVELKELEEEIQDRILNIARREVEAIEPGDADLNNGIWEGLYARARALEEEAGSNPKLVKGLHDVEAALVQYHELIKRRMAAMGELAQVAEASIRARGKSEEGKTRPDSVIRERRETPNSYGVGEKRRTVELRKKEQPDSSKRDLAAERMKTVMEYRSGPNRAVPLAEINKEPVVRAKMHKIYEDFNARWNAMQKEGNEKAMSLQTSIDPALDYALNVYKAQAKQDGKFRYGAQERAQALERIQKANEALGWFSVENAGIDVEELLSLQTAATEAEPISLTRKKRATSKHKQDQIEENVALEAPAVVEPLKLDLTEFVKEEEEQKAKEALEKELAEAPAPYYGRGPSRPAREKRKIRHDAQYKPVEEPNQPEQEPWPQPSVPLTDAERARISEALNVKNLALGDDHDAVIKEVFELLGNDKPDWIGSYVSLYDSYLKEEEHAPKSKAVKELRDRLSKLNLLFGIDNPRELLKGDTNATREAVRKAEESRQGHASVRPPTEPTGEKKPKPKKGKAGNRG